MPRTAERAARAIEALQQRINELVDLPPDKQLAVAQDLDRTLDKWLYWLSLSTRTRGC